MPRKTTTGLAHTKTVKRGKVEYVYFNTGEKVDGKVVYTSLGKKGAIELGAKYSAALAARTKRGSAPSSILIPEMVDRYQRSPEFTKRSFGTQKTYGVYLRRLANEFNNAPAGGVEQSDIYELMDDMAEKPAAVEMLLLAGTQMFAWAVKRNYVRANPFEGIDREEWQVRDYQPWPEAVVDAALKDEKIRLPVALLYYTAQRIGDTCRMLWTDIEADVIFVRQQKTGKEMEIPIHSHLAEILAEAPRRGATIMADAKGRPMKHPTIRTWLKDFGKERGLDLVPHGLRKNAVNALLEAECSTAQVSAISGQSLRMVEHYARKRNNPRIGRLAMGKWERSSNRETNGKTSPELQD